jgi:hypothetical protein
MSIGNSLCHLLVRLPTPPFGFAQTLIKVDHVIKTVFLDGNVDECFEIGKLLIAAWLLECWRLDFWGG